MTRKDEIKELMEKFRNLECSTKNRIRREKWDCLPYTARDHWRAKPKMDGSWRQGQLPIQVYFSNSFWSKYFNFSLKDYYLDGEIFLLNYLKIMIENFELFDDDVFLVKRIPVWMGAGFEASLLGMKVFYADDTEPWTDYKHIINDYSDLDEMILPNFRTTGLNPAAIKMFETVKELVDEDFDVLFSEWLRGPFGCGLYIRGFENMLVDLLEAPEFVHKLMRYVTDSRKKWYADLEKYLGRPIISANMFNDEINCPALSPKLYEELVLPYEIELSEYHKGISYWHSCGNITELYNSISKVPNIDMIHRGPWSSTREVASVFGTKSALDICINPQAEILQASESEMKNQFTEIIKDLSDYDVKGCMIRATNIMFQDSLQHPIEQAQKWIRMAKGVIN